MESVAPSLVQKPLSQFERVIYTFISPAEAFRDVLRNKSWVIALLLTVFSSYFYSVTIVQKVGLDQTVHNMIRNNAQLERQYAIASEQQQRMQVSVSEFFLRWSMICEPLLVICLNLFLAVVFLGSFNVVFDTKVNFSAAFCVLIYADLINNIKPLLSAALLWFGYPPSQFDIQNPVGTDLGYYFPGLGNPAVKSLLFSVDVVMIWYLIVIAIGFAVVGRLKLGQSLAVVFGWWSVLLFARIALASIGSHP